MEEVLMLRYKCEYLKSDWITPLYNPISDMLPFSVHDMGEFICNKNHYTEGSDLALVYIIYTVSGCADLSFRDNKYKLNQGSMVIINCDDYHHYINNYDTPWHFFKIAIEGTSLKVFDFLINGSRLRIFDMSYNIFINLFNKLKVNLNENQPLSVVSNSLEITKFLSMCAENLKYEKKENAVETAMKYMNERYKQSITLDELAKSVNISKYHLIRMFKSHLGITPYRYLNRLRISKAQQLLILTDKSIGQIAYEVGISDESSFIKQFKDNVGCTPHKYRTEKAVAEFN